MTTGTARGRIHLEVETDQCLCPRLTCGGVEIISASCPEHSNLLNPRMKVHSHPIQVRRNSVYRGRAV